MERVRVKELMVSPPPVLRDDLTVKEFFNRYFLKYRDHFVFPVKAKDDRIVGVIALRDVNNIPTSEWD
ncbi:MAG: CBS domain-containing protein, partial [Candidatus Korarchaeota archaeon]|nr:CBS domain-containing protein [Candidatus Korarchaeota archaeon]